MAFKKGWFEFIEYGENGVDVLVREQGALNTPIYASVTLDGEDADKLRELLGVSPAEAEQPVEAEVVAPPVEDPVAVEADEGLSPDPESFDDDLDSF